MKSKKTDFVGRVEQMRQNQLFSNESRPSVPEKLHTLLPALHTNRDFFLADLLDYAMKDDGVSMEAPIFTLSTKPDLSIWHWKSKDGARSMEVYPSVKGRATQFDKDVLIYVVSQMTEALNRKREAPHPPFLSVQISPGPGWSPGACHPHTRWPDAPPIRSDILPPLT